MKDKILLWVPSLGLHKRSQYGHGFKRRYILSPRIKYNGDFQKANGMFTSIKLKTFHIDSVSLRIKWSPFLK